MSGHKVIIFLNSALAILCVLLERNIHVENVYIFKWWHTFTGKGRTTQQNQNYYNDEM